MSQAQNPFFKEYTTPLGTVPFNEIKTSHYEEAIDRGIKLAKAQIDAIAAQKSEPTFEKHNRGDGKFRQGPRPCAQCVLQPQ